ncbi:hypothetical protein [Saccharothrix deserti]|uniref:hypothetical protein n=1 Tax=Saccharothrix deserti TaxID=2593674 RepID=UPI00131CC1EB|nr:hypothetical protein [Saccharothrix deserti]
MASGPPHRPFEVDRRSAEAKLSVLAVGFSMAMLDTTVMNVIYPVPGRPDELGLSGHALDRVHPRDPDAAEDDLDAGVGEDAVEQGGDFPSRSRVRNRVAAASSRSMTSRTHPGVGSRFRRLARRYERKATHFAASARLACAVICYRRAVKLDLLTHNNLR